MKEKTIETQTYWNHNTAYHKWILSHIKEEDSVLDVGCGDGLLVYHLAKKCKKVLGIDNHMPSIKNAKHRLSDIKNAAIENIDFEKINEKDNSFDVIIFVASIHHMNLENCIKKSKRLLKSNGKLLIVGLAYPANVWDHVIELSRIIPAKIGDMFHDVKGDVGAPITDAKENMNDIRNIITKYLPNAKLKQALYYRYLLSWTKK